MIFKKLDRFIRDWNHKRIDLFRNILITFFKFLFDHQLFCNKNLTLQNKILILRLDDKLGDCIASTGFLKSIKEAKPNSQLIVVAGKSTTDVYKNLSFVDEVILCQKGIIGTLNCFLKLCGNKYDVIANTSHILNPRVIFIMSNLVAREKFGFLNLQFKLFTQTAQYNELTDHVTKRYEKLLQLMQLSQYSLNYTLNINQHSLKKIDHLISHTDKLNNKKIILINSFAGARLRNFSYETTILLIEKILKLDNFIVISVANKGDQSIVKDWRQRNTNLTNWLQFEDVYTLDDNLALLSRSQLLITPDTAWVHMASALGINLIAVFRKDFTPEKNALIWAPMHSNSRVIITEPSLEDPHNINSFSHESLLTELKYLMNSVP